MTNDGHSDIVIIGGVAAGPKTAATLARRNPNLSITLFQKEKYMSYATCGMPFFASGDISSFNELLVTSYGLERDPLFFEKAKGFKAVTEAEVIAIDRENKIVTVKMLATGETCMHGYDKLVIATGSKPSALPFDVPSSDKIKHFTRPDDAVAFRKLAETGQVGSAVIIGGGFIGCELMGACAELWGIETTLIEVQDQLLPYVLDPEIAAIAEREAKRNDVNIITGVGVEKITIGDDENPIVHIKGREPITADFVFLALGVHPETELAQKCGLDLGVTGGIVVNKFMQTSDPDIYAGGDCTEATNRLTGKALYIPMGSLANRHGRVIAEHIAGNKQPFKGVLGTFVIKIFETNVGAVGLSEKAARKSELDVVEVWGSWPDKPDYYPEYGTFTLKMTYEKSSHKLLGLQAVGKGDICRRIDSFSAFLNFDATVEDLLDFEHGYAPPYSEALDPLHHLAGMAIAREAGYEFISPADCLTINRSNSVIIDVREAEEFSAQPLSNSGSAIEGVINIPLMSLRERAKDIDTGKEIYILCKRGVRSYQAACILKAAGFGKIKIIGGGIQATN